MTVQEFDNKSFTIDDLYDLCSDASVWDPFDDIYSSDSVEETINDRLYDYVRNEDWRDVRDMLNSIDLDDGGEWYIEDDYSYMSFIRIDNDDTYIEDLKERCREALIEAHFFDEEEEEPQIEWFEQCEPDLEFLTA